jgi:hypothetical protein
LSQIVPAGAGSTLNPEIRATHTRDDGRIFTFNGLRLTDEAYDVMLSLAANNVVHDGVAPIAARTRPDFPYYGALSNSEEQAGLQAIQGNIGYGSESGSG